MIKLGFAVVPKDRKLLLPVLARWHLSTWAGSKISGRGKAKKVGRPVSSQQPTLAHPEALLGQIVEF